MTYYVEFTTTIEVEADSEDEALEEARDALETTYNHAYDFEAYIEEVHK